EDNWIYLFSDGVVARASRNASVDVRLWRQNFRVFLMEFSFFLNNGYKKVRIQTDNLEVITVLSMEELVDSGITLLRRVKRFLCSNSQRETKYVPKSVI
ncbi:hypothetical protein Goarm_007100, partial [Gossypium armourianum]|nr:hypothetical protein [Gossypium armourianum]